MYTEHETENELKTTPEFRSFVAKHLEKMLDKYVIIYPMFKQDYLLRGFM